MVEVVKTKALFLDCEIVVDDVENFDFANSEQYCGAYFQSPDSEGIIRQFGDKIQ